MAHPLPDSRLQTVRHAAVPVAAFALAAAVWGAAPGNVILAGLALVLLAAVLTAVYHAEVVALRVGEPYGSVILAVAVTVIEAGLIVSLMISSPETTTGLARDAIFAAVMIAVNGVVGISLVVATLRRGLTAFNPEGTGAALAAIATLTVLSLVLPNFTTSAEGPVFSPPQLVFAAVASLAVYLVFVFVQNVRHRDFFLPPDDAGGAQEDVHIDPPSSRRALASLALLVLALAGVVGLAKATAPLIETGVAWAGLPAGVIAVAIALVVLLPESLAAIRASARGRIQTSFNLGYGSALATIGLTIPTVAVLSLILGLDLELGLSTVSIALLALTLFVSALTVAPGRATLLEGTMHLVLLAGFIVLVLFP